MTTVTDFLAERVRAGRCRAVLGLFLVGALATFAACGSTKQDDYRDLREYAVDDSVPLAERTSALMAIASNGSEVTHLRAVAIQMLGVLQVEEAKPVMLGVLGWVDGEAARAPRRPLEAPANDEGDEFEVHEAPIIEAPLVEGALDEDEPGQPSRSELLRLEAVVALGRFADPRTYDAVLRLIYEDRRDPSALVVRQYLQSFAFAPSTGDAQAAATGEVLLRWIRIALDRNEDASLIVTALTELRRITGRPDLNAEEFSAWEAQLTRMRRS